MEDFTIRPAVNVDVAQILEAMQSSRPRPIPQISLGDNVESGIGSIDPSVQLDQTNSLARKTTSTFPRIKFVAFPVSIMMLLKHLIRTR
jgi:hypothetical protein